MLKPNGGVGECTLQAYDRTSACPIYVAWMTGMLRMQVQLCRPTTLMLHDGRAHGEKEDENKAVSFPQLARWIFSQLDWEVG